MLRLSVILTAGGISDKSKNVIKLLRRTINMKAKLSHAIAVLLSMLMILSLVACGNSGTNTKNSESADKSGDTTTAEVATEEDVF